MNKPSTSYLPTHDGHRGAIIKWPVNCHQAFDKGVASAQTWLSNDNTGWLWANLILERDALPPGYSVGPSRSAFSAGCTSACARPTAAITRPGKPADHLYLWRAGCRPEEPVLFNNQDGP